MSVAIYVRETWKLYKDYLNVYIQHYELELAVVDCP